MRKLVVVSLLVCSIVVVNAQKISLGYNLKEGSTFYMNQTSVQNIHQDLMGNSMDIKVTVGARTSYTVMKVDQGNSNLEVVYETMSMKMESPMMNMDFDSKGTIDAANPMHTALNAIVGQKFDMVMNAKGKVLSVTGFEAVMDSLVSKMNGDKSMVDQIAANIKQQFGDEAMKGSMEMMTAVFPDAPVAVGDTWVVKSTIRTGMELLSENTLTLKDASNGKWVLSGASNLVTNSDLAVPTNGMTSHFTLSGTAQYDLVLDASTGWLVETKINQVIDGKVAIEGGQLPSAMEIPMKIESVTSVTNI